MAAVVRDGGELCGFYGATAGGAGVVPLAVRDQLLPMDLSGEARFLFFMFYSVFFILWKSAKTNTHTHANHFLFYLFVNDFFLYRAIPDTV